MSRKNETYKCPWKDCQGTYPIAGSKPNRLVTVHTNNGKPCPGGGFSLDKPIEAELPKLVNRARGSGLI